MPRHRTPIDRAVGRLISAIQKEWLTEHGEPAEVAEYAMNRVHELLQATKTESVNAVLGNQSLADYLGKLWLRRHPAVMLAVNELESLIRSSPHR